MISRARGGEPGGSAAAPERSLGLAATIVKARYRVDAIASVSRDVVRYTAEDLESGRPLMLEVLRDEFAADPEFVAALRDQAGKLAKSTHLGRAVARVYDCDITDAGELFVVLERTQGRPLREILEARGPLDPPTALRIASQVGEALEMLHHHGIVHGELNADSIVIVGDGDGLANVKLVGVELTAARRTMPGDRVRDAATASELAPEQTTRGETTEASDVYALGRLLRNLLTGGALRETNGPLLGPSPVPPAAQRIIAKAIQARPDARYPDISVMLNDIWAAHTALGEPQARPRSQPPARIPPRRRFAQRRRFPRRLVSLRRTTTGVATAVVAVVAVIGGVVAFERLVSLARVTPALDAAHPSGLRMPTPTEDEAPAPSAQRANETPVAAPPSARVEPPASAAAPTAAPAPRAGDRHARDVGDGSAIIDWLLKEGR